MLQTGGRCPVPGTSASGTVPTKPFTASSKSCRSAKGRCFAISALASSVAASGALGAIWASAAGQAATMAMAKKLRNNSTPEVGGHRQGLAGVLLVDHCLANWIVLPRAEAASFAVAGIAVNASIVALTIVHVFAIASEFAFIFGVGDGSCDKPARPPRCESWQNSDAHGEGGASKAQAGRWSQRSCSRRRSEIRVRTAHRAGAREIYGRRGCGSGGVHETSIYRRWGTPNALLVDAWLAYFDDAIPIPDTGTLRSDLIALGEGGASVHRSPQGQAILALILVRDEHALKVKHEYWQRRFDVCYRSSTGQLRAASFRRTPTLLSCFRS